MFESKTWYKEVTILIVISHVIEFALGFAMVLLSYQRIISFANRRIYYLRRANSSCSFYGTSNLEDSQKNFIDKRGSVIIFDFIRNNLRYVIIVSTLHTDAIVNRIGVPHSLAHTHEISW